MFVAERQNIFHYCYYCQVAGSVMIHLKSNHPPGTSFYISTLNNPSLASLASSLLILSLQSTKNVRRTEIQLNPSSRDPDMFQADLNLVENVSLMKCNEDS